MSCLWWVSNKDDVVLNGKVRHLYIDVGGVIVEMKKACPSHALDHSLLMKHLDPLPEQGGCHVSVRTRSNTTMDVD